MNRTIWIATGLFASIGITIGLGGCSDGSTSSGSDGSKSTGADFNPNANPECPYAPEPHVGEACKLESTIDCLSEDVSLYPNGPDCDPHYVHCVNGTWQALLETESSPAVICPATPPADGDPCPSLSCSSHDKSCFYDCVSASCKAGDAHWRLQALVSNEDGGTCPGALDGGAVDASADAAPDDAGDGSGDRG